MDDLPKICQISTTEGLLATVDRLDTTRLPRLCLNRVTDLSGRTELDGLSGGLSSRNDRALLSHIRSTSDAVLIGGRTYRDEGYRPSNPDFVDSKLIVLSRNGAGIEDPNVTVLSMAPKPASFRGIWMTRSSWNPSDVVAALSDLGLNRIICEGGPSFTQPFLEAGLIAEMYITVSPQVGPPAPNFNRQDIARASNRFDLTYAIRDTESFLFTKWTAV